MEYFGFESDDAGKPKIKDLATCRLCRNEVLSNARNTSNLFDHLQTHRPAEYNATKTLKAIKKQEMTAKSGVGYCAV